MSLYRRLIGAPFDRLPPAVRAVHGATAGVRVAGVSEVRRGRNALSRLLGAWLGVPRAADSIDLQFEISVHDQTEQWTRRFGDSVMRSRFWAKGGALFEQVGPVVMQYTLEVDDDGLHTRLRDVRFLGLPLPRALQPRMRALASQDDRGRYRFDIAVEMPVVGLVVSYRGHLGVPLGGKQ